MSPVNPELVGEIWPSAEPFSDRSQYGHVTMTPSGAFEVRSLQTFKLVFTVGCYGMDDTGALRVVFRFPLDIGSMQTSNPSGLNYVTAHSNKGVKLTVEYHPHGHMRPRYRALTVFVSGGYLSEGDTITVIFGDTTGGSSGMQLQTFCESAFEFKVLVDIYATGYFVPLPETPCIRIVPGKPVLWKAVVPTLRRVGEHFSLCIKAEDKWGNPSDQVEEDLFLESNLPIDNLPTQIAFPKGQRSLQILDLTLPVEGVYRIQIYNSQREHLVDANPLVVRTGALAAYWGDLHGQTGESVAINSAREFFSFARDLAFLDVASHQANDFQIKNAFWQQLNALTAEFHEKHRFVTFPGYEWSGNTCIGGDHNVYFRHEGRPIHRSSHALVADTSDNDTDAPTLQDLFTALANEDCVVYAHVGGRFADTSYAHDPKIETAMEIHSAWGTFEWLLTDGFLLGHRSGVVCNSDDHKGRPGASHPGASNFGAYGGLTCFLASELTRDGIFNCLRRRHHYGTSGNRIHLDVRARFNESANLFEKDPTVFEISPIPVDEAIMGDIVQTDEERISLHVETVSHTPIERVDILNGKDIINTLRGYSPENLGNRIRVVWSGAKCRGRGRKTRWNGKAIFENTRIKHMAKINSWNPERSFELNGHNEVHWEAVTTGNWGGFDVWFEDFAGGCLVLKTDSFNETVKLSEIGFEDIVFDTGGLERHLRVFRLPETNTVYELRDELAVPIKPTGDNPLWVRVTTEDGFNAWSSPIFIYRNQN